MVIGRILNKFINIFTGLFGIATVVLLLLLYINATVHILPAQAAANIAVARDYTTLATVFCAGVEFTFKRNIILAIVFAAIIAALAAFMIYSNIKV